MSSPLCRQCYFSWLSKYGLVPRTIMDGAGIARMLPYCDDDIGTEPDLGENTSTTRLLFTGVGRIGLDPQCFFIPLVPG